MRGARGLVLGLLLASGIAQAQDTVGAWNRAFALPAGHVTAEVNTGGQVLSVVDLAGGLLEVAAGSLEVRDGLPGVRTRWRSSARGTSLAHVTVSVVAGQPRTRLGFGANPHGAPTIDLPGIWEFLLDDVGATVVAVRRLGPAGHYELRVMDATGTARTVPGLATLQTQNVLGLSLSGDGRRLALSVADEAHVFALDGGGRLYTLPGAGTWQLSADGRYAAVLAPARVRVYDANVQIASFTTAKPPRGVAFTEGTVAVIDASVVHLLDLPGGAARTLTPALAGGERLGSVDLHATPAGPLIALGVLSVEPVGGKARLELRRPDGSTTRWPAFSAVGVEARSPRVRFTPGGDRLLAWTRGLLREALVP